jgi:hypothetical protein
MVKSADRGANVSLRRGSQVTSKDEMRRGFSTAHLALYGRVSLNGSAFFNNGRLPGKPIQTATLTASGHRAVTNISVYPARGWAAQSGLSLMVTVLPRIFPAAYFPETGSYDRESHPDVFAISY